MNKAKTNNTSKKPANSCKCAQAIKAKLAEVTEQRDIALKAASTKTAEFSELEEKNKQLVTDNRKLESDAAQDKNTIRKKDQELKLIKKDAAAFGKVKIFLAFIVGVILTIVLGISFA